MPRIRSPVCYVLALAQLLAGCLLGDVPSKCGKPSRFVRWKWKVQWKIRKPWGMCGSITNPCSTIKLNYKRRRRYLSHTSEVQFIKARDYLPEWINAKYTHVLAVQWTTYLNTGRGLAVQNTQDVEKLKDLYQEDMYIGANLYILMHV